MRIGALCCGVLLTCACGWEADGIDDLDQVGEARAELAQSYWTGNGGKLLYYRFDGNVAYNGDGNLTPLAADWSGRNVPTGRYGGVYAVTPSEVYSSSRYAARFEGNGCLTAAGDQANATSELELRALVCPRRTHTAGAMLVGRTTSTTCRSGRTTGSRSSSSARRAPG